MAGSVRPGEVAGKAFYKHREEGGGVFSGVGVWAGTYVKAAIGSKMRLDSHAHLDKKRLLGRKAVPEPAQRVSAKHKFDQQKLPVCCPALFAGSEPVALTRKETLQHVTFLKKIEAIAIDARSLSRHGKEALLHTHLTDLYATLTEWLAIPPAYGVAVRDQLETLLLSGDRFTHQDLCQIIPIEKTTRAAEHEEKNGEKKRSIAEIMHGRQADGDVNYRGVLSGELMKNEDVKEAMIFAEKYDIARFGRGRKLPDSQPVTQSQTDRRNSRRNNPVTSPVKKQPEHIKKRTRYERESVSPDPWKQQTVKKQGTPPKVHSKASAWQESSEDFEDLEQLVNLGEQHILKKHLDTVLEVEAQITRLQNKKQSTLKTGSSEFRQLETLVKRWKQLNPEKSVRVRDELERCLMASKQIGYLKVSQSAAIVGLGNQRTLSVVFQELIHTRNTLAHSQLPHVSFSPHSPQQHDNDFHSDVESDVESDIESDVESKDTGYESLENSQTFSDSSDPDSDDEEEMAVYQNFARILDEEEETDTLGALPGEGGKENTLSRLRAANKAETLRPWTLNTAGAIDEEREERAFRQLLEQGRPPANMHPSRKEVETGSLKKTVSSKTDKKEKNQAHWAAMEKLERIIIMTEQQVKIMSSDQMVEDVEKRWSKALYRKAACRVLEKKTGKSPDADNTTMTDEAIDKAIKNLKWGDYDSEYRDALIQAVEDMAWEAFYLTAADWEKIPLTDNNEFPEREALFQWMTENIKKDSLVSVRDFYHSRDFDNKMEAIKQRLSAP